MKPPLRWFFFVHVNLWYHCKSDNMLYYQQYNSLSYPCWFARNCWILSLIFSLSGVKVLPSGQVQVGAPDPPQGLLPGLPEPGVKVVPSGQVQLSGFTPAPQGLLSEFRTLSLIFSRNCGWATAAATANKQHRANRVFMTVEAEDWSQQQAAVVWS